MLKVELNHVFLGAGIALMGATALWARLRPTSRVRFVWPALLILLGYSLAVPPETAATQYEPSTWWRTLIGIFNIDVGEWLAGFEHRHVVQHRVIGVITMGVGVVELARSAGRLRADAWERLLPLALVAVAALSTLGHGGNEMHLQNPGERTHHLVFGVLFLSGAVLLALHQWSVLKNRWWGHAWTVLVLLSGLEFAVLFRVPG